jgi:hypothetical protein
VSTGNASPGYLEAFGRLAARIAASLTPLPRRAPPVRMTIAGGAALHFHTGEGAPCGIDAAFSRPVVLPARLEDAYGDKDGSARLLYLDRAYNGTLAPMHPQAREDSRVIALEGVDARVLEVRVLAPIDLAVSKLGRFSAQDRADIALLARHRLISAAALRRRLVQALQGYVGSVAAVRARIEPACRIAGGARRR